ncbi:hypothetical protein GGG16DRAFT_126715 [Schizophyllum commune]
MVGCSLLLQVSKALSRAKSDPRPFGGINVILAGDFAQLPPVLMTKLYAPISTKGRQSTRMDDNIHGKLLWLSFDTVVMLHEIRRQSSTDGKEFIDLLQRLREGRCTAEDYDLLMSRVITNARPDWSDESMRAAPMIVAQNELKDSLNIRAAVTFARRSKQELHWYLTRLSELTYGA